MTSVVCHLSDQIIITNDNPRNEDPHSIIKDMLKDLDPCLKKKVLVINDRRQAIKTACTIANKKDIVLVAGKGHEKYQEVNGESHFDTRRVKITKYYLIMLYYIFEYLQSL